MRYLNTRITSTLLVLLLVALVACDTISGDPDLPIPLDETMNNTGAFLRIASVETAAFDVADLSTSEYSFVAEYFDGEGASLLDNIEFYVSYQSFALDPEDQVTIPETSEPFYTVSASEFTEDEDSGLPTATISVPFQDVIAGLGLDAEDVNLEDQFNLRWVLNLTDGRSFSASDASPAVGGGFYNSPYTARVFTVQQLEETQFAGEYLFEAQGTGVFGWHTFSESFTAELTVDPNNTINGRVFTQEPYADDWGGLTPITVPVVFGQTASVNTSSDGIGTGLGCAGGPGLAVGPMTDDSNITLIDIEDDSQFTMVVGDNVRSDCGAGPTDVIFNVTKQ